MELVCTYPIHQGYIHFIIIIGVSIAFGVLIWGLLYKQIKSLEIKLAELTHDKAIVVEEWEKVDTEWVEIEKLYGLVQDKCDEILCQLRDRNVVVIGNQDEFTGSIKSVIDCINHNRVKKEIKESLKSLDGNGASTDIGGLN